MLPVNWFSASTIVAESSPGQGSVAAKEQAQKHQLDQDKLLACVQKQDESAVRASMAEGDKLGVDSTPTIFVNGERFSGLVPERDFRAALDRALQEAGQGAAPTSAKK